MCATLCAGRGRPQVDVDKDGCALGLLPLDALDVDAELQDTHFVNSPKMYLVTLPNMLSKSFHLQDFTCLVRRQITNKHKSSQKMSLEKAVAVYGGSIWWQYS